MCVKFVESYGAEITLRVALYERESRRRDDTHILFHPLNGLLNRTRATARNEFALKIASTFVVHEFAGLPV